MKSREFDEIFDLVAVRVIVPSMKDCYAALGCIHGRWRPIVGTVQGLHRDAEVQPVPELAHHGDRSGRQADRGPDPDRGDAPARRVGRGGALGVQGRRRQHVKDIDWLNRIIDWQEEVSDPAQFMESLKTDLEQDEVFVFTPKGRVVTLPVGSTTVDFAYAVHTEVGHACIGAKINGRLVPLDQTVQSGDNVEIFTSKVETAGPSQDWLAFVGSPRARNKIRQWFSRERRLDTIEAGRDDLTDRLRREGLPVQRIWKSPQLEAVITELSYVRPRRDAAGGGRAPRVGPECGPEDRPRVPDRRRRRAAARPRSASHPPGDAATTGATTVGVHVEGLDDVMVRLAVCCTPVPGDDIIGFVTRGRGVSVHRSDCANAVSLMAEPGDSPGRRRLGRRGEVRRPRSSPASKWWRSTGRGC